MTTIQTIDPAAVLQAAFPWHLIESTARECRFVQRRRDFDPHLFFWALITCVLAHSTTSIAAVWREYERLAGKSIDRSSFYKHFNDHAAEFLRQMDTRSLTKNYHQLRSPGGSRSKAQTPHELLLL